MITSQAGQIKQLKLLIDGEARRTAASEYSDIYDSSTRSVIAQAPLCAVEEVDAAVQSCARVPDLGDMPAMKRVQVLYRFRAGAYRPGDHQREFWLHRRTVPRI